MKYRFPCLVIYTPTNEYMLAVRINDAGNILLGYSLSDIVLFKFPLHKTIFLR